MALQFRSLEPSDAEALQRLCTQPDVARQLVFSPSEPVSAFANRLEKATPDQHCLIAAEQDGRLVGALWLEASMRARRKHSGSLWLAVLPEAQRRGIGRTLLEQAIHAADRWYNLCRIECDVPADQAHVLRLLSRVGFVEEVRHRSALLRDGARVDLLTMSWLRPGTQSQTQTPNWPVRAERIPDGEIVFRIPAVADAPLLASFFSDPSVYWGTMQLPFCSTRSWLNRVNSGNDGVRHHSVLVEVGGRIAGLAGLHGNDVARTRHSFMMGMSVSRAFQGRGLGDALMRHLMRLADEWLGIERIELDVYADNSRAVALYRKHGFEPEGIRRCDAWRDGAFADSLVMARLRR